MNEAPGQQSPEMQAIKHEIREAHGGTADATSVPPQEEEQVIAEEFEKDPARNPDNEALQNIKGG